MFKGMPKHVPKDGLLVWSAMFYSTLVPATALQKEIQKSAFASVS